MGDARPEPVGTQTGEESALAAAVTVEQACRAAVEHLAAPPRLLPSVYLLVDGRLRCQAARGYFQVVDGFPPGTGVLGRVVLTGVGEVIQDVHAHPEFIAAVPGLRAEVCEPIRVDGQVIGGLNVESPDRLTPETVAATRATASALAARIELLGGLPPDPLPQRAARVAVGLSALTDAAEIVDQALDGAVELSGMASAAISEPDADGRWGVRRATGPLAEQLHAWGHDDHRTIARWVGAGTSAHFPDGEQSPPGYEFLHRAGVRAIGVQPLVVAGRVTGLLTTADTEPSPHDALVAAAVELLAAQVAATLATARAMAELSRLARHDQLTGLPNAASFAADLEDVAVATRRRGSVATACVLLDVDHFKVVNDTHGHPAGDDVLRGLSDVLRQVLRAGDVLYRVGGDEFAALVSASSRVEVAAVLDRLVDAARRSGTTVSAGAALVQDDRHARVRVVADRALYSAKSQGRDRWVVDDDDLVSAG